ncbi:MAG: methylated-DNA-[protein]-cysteine S-methyltransferase [Patescibacteria group bacterium]|nr:methylated-DNA-[protein]-cysteine S-methyltransferase [Patescibacteria group bacterium]
MIMGNKITLFQKLVYAATKKIPRGKVSTYRDIARAIGRSKSARAVGNALNKNPFALASIRRGVLSSRSGPVVPCHRVVKSTGEIGGFASGCGDKIKLLRKEGVLVEKGRVVDFENKRVFFSFTKYEMSEIRKDDEMLTFCIS